MKKLIKGTSNYFVNELGEVFNRKGDLIRHHKSRDGYMVVGLYIDGKTKNQNCP